MRSGREGSLRGDVWIKLNDRKRQVEIKKHSKQKELPIQRPWGMQRLDRGGLRDLHPASYLWHLSPWLAWQPAS